MTDLGAVRNNLLVVTLGINHLVQNARLIVSIWGSGNGDPRRARAMLSFPPKSYCGIYTTFLNLAQHPGVRYLQVRWNIDGRGPAGAEPFFGFYVEANDSKMT
jgi:hypothetical protein